MGEVVKITKSDSLNDYTVSLDGIVVGEVRKKVQRYNLRRTITVTYWYATRKEPRQRFPADPGSGYGSRRDAVAALVAAVRDES